MGDLGNLPGQVQSLVVQLTQIAGWLWPFMHPQLIVKALLEGSLGVLLKVWFGFVLHTTDFETGRDFTANVTIQAFEPKVQLAADAALTIVAIWASYRIMWGHGLRTQYSARILLPRLLMAAVLINFALPLFEVVVQASNAACDAIMSFGTLPDWDTWWRNLAQDQTGGVMQFVTTAVLVVGYDVLGIVYIVRYTILIVLAITAPLAGLLFTLPETHHMAKQWSSLFVSNLLMQPAQLFVIAIGFALEMGGHTGFHHLFAMAALLVVFKVPGALGGSEKVAHRLEAAVTAGFHMVQHAVAHA